MIGFFRHLSSRSRAAIALLLFCVLVFSGCATQAPSSKNSDSDKQSASQSERESTKETKETKKASTQPEKSEPTVAKEKTSKESSEQAKKVREAQKSMEAKVGKSQDAPKFKDWNEKNKNSEPIQLNSGGSAGAIPAVKPFNFGRDPGGPKDKTLYLTVPKIGLEDVPIYNSTSEEDLTKSAVHVPATGFPWQDGANTFIAGHRLGYPDTGSYNIFFDLNLLGPGDEIDVTDSDGGSYVYQVTDQQVVSPDNVEVMNPVEGKSIVSLQTCTLPDYTERIIVQGELVESST